MPIHLRSEEFSFEEFSCNNFLLAQIKDFTDISSKQDNLDPVIGHVLYSPDCELILRKV